MTIREKKERYKKKVATRNTCVVIGCIIFLVLAFLLSMNTGYAKLSPLDTIRTMFGGGTKRHELILFEFRLPRIVISTLIGMGLALSGCIIQGVTRNPLADPGLLGISSGSGFMVILFVIFFGTENFLSIFTLPFLALIGASVVAVLVYALAYQRQSGVAPVRLVLTGVAVQAGISAFTTILVVRLDEKQYEFVAAWQAGQIWGVNWKFVLALFPWLCLLIPYVLCKARSLDVLSLGDDVAVSLGASVERERRLLLASSVALAASCVAVGGNISFVGLVAPHLARQLVGGRHTILLPVSALIGAILVSMADLIGRTLVNPSAIPTGIMTAIIGAPYFIYLLIKNK